MYWVPAFNSLRPPSIWTGSTFWWVGILRLLLLLFDERGVVTLISDVLVTFLSFGAGSGGRGGVGSHGQLLSIFPHNDLEFSFFFHRPSWPLGRLSDRRRALHLCVHWTTLRLLLGGARGRGRGPRNTEPGGIKN